MPEIMQWRFEGTKEDRVSVRAFLKLHRFPKSVISSLKGIPGAVLADDVPVKMNALLTGGETVTVRFPEETGSGNIVPEDIPLDILYEDDAVLVVNKPSGMSVHSSMNHHGKTLANACAFHFLEEGHRCAFHCVNRLDRDTTGVTVIAKDRLSAAILGEAAEARMVHREYLAVVTGITEKQGVVDAPLGRVPGSVILRQVDPENGQAAHTAYERLGTAVYGADGRPAFRTDERGEDSRAPGDHEGGEAFRADAQDGFAKDEGAGDDGPRTESPGDVPAGETYSLLRLRLGTGRTHQIRVHMLSIGHPIPGDYLYNEDYRRIGRQALHSHAVTFPHPLTGEPMRFTAPLPEDMRTMLGLGMEVHGFS